MSIYIRIAPYIYICTYIVWLNINARVCTSFFCITLLAYL